MDLFLKLTTKRIGCAFAELDGPARWPTIAFILSRIIRKADQNLVGSSKDAYGDRADGRAHVPMGLANGSRSGCGALTKDSFHNLGAPLASALVRRLHPHGFAIRERV